MPRKTLFSRTHRQDKDKDSAKSRGAKETAPPQPTKPTAVVNSWTEAALEKANMAVLYDFTGSPKQALDAYNEAIGLLDKVFGSVTDDCTDQTRLKKIYGSYTDRVATLTHQINNNELDATPSVSIPVAQLSQSPLPPPPISTDDIENSSLPTPSDSPKGHTDCRRPSLSSRSDQEPAKSSFLDSKKPAIPPPPPVPDKLPYVPVPPPPKSPSGSLFGSMFMKKHASKEQLKPTSSSHSLFSMPGPSKSTPTLSMNKSPKSWKKQSSKKKQRHSTELETVEISPPTFSSSKIDLTTLTLPDVDIPNDDDYFDLHSTMETKNLLYSRPEPMLASLRDLHEKHADKSDTHSQQQEENNPSHHSNTDEIAGIKIGSTATRTRSSSSSSSNNTACRYEPQSKSYASSLLTGNSSIYSPVRSSFYSTTYTYRDEDEYSIASSKYPPSQSLLLPDISAGNNSSSFFDETSDCAMESLAKLLADSAATMPDRPRRTTGPGASIAAVIEEPEPELSSSSFLTSTTTTTTTIGAISDFESNQARSNTTPLDRSPSSKSVSSTKSRDSAHSSSSSKRNKSSKSSKNNNGDDPTVTPLPSNSSKSISFWNKRNKASSKTTKPKTIKTLPPLHMNVTEADALLSPLGGSNSAPSTPRSIATSIGQAFLSPTSTTAPPTSSSKRLAIPPSAPTTPHHTYFGAEITSTTKSKGIDVTIIMDPSTHNESNKQPKLMARLLQSMEEGGYVTERIHAPKQLWYQNQVRLPAIDAKISSCEQLLALLHRMHTHTPHFGAFSQKDITTEALHDLGRLEHVLDQIKQNFGKVTFDASLAPPTPTASSSHSIQPSLASSSAYQQASSHPPPPPPPQDNLKSITDPMAQWGNKLSKSVERMRIEAKSSEEQVHAYISTLIRLFSMASVLDEWRDTLMELSGSVPMNKAYLFDLILQKTMMCTGTLHTVVCSFVMRDFAILLNKWLKRCREWTLDD